MIKKSEFIWNSIASIIASALSAVLLLFATRINGSDAAGMFAITFATATILNAIGDFGIRIVQVTDVKRKYSFDDYIYARLIVSTLMIIVAILFVSLSGYPMNKALLCVALVAYRVVEVISETYQGELQLRQHLDIAAHAVVYRTIGAILIFIICDIASGNLLYSVIAMIIWGIIVLILFDTKKIKQFVTITWIWNKQKVKELLIMCFPTFFSTFMNLYIVNAPKYAIDSIMTYKDQTIFNIIFLPTFTINLFSIFILKPMLLTLGVMWNEKRFSEFKKIIKRMLVLIFTLTCFIEVACWLIGIPILSMIYGLNLELYKLDLIILIISGGLSAFCIMLFYVLTTMRCQKEVAIPYIITASSALLICPIFVREFGIRGAAISSVIITSLLFITSLVIVLWALKKKTAVQEM